MKYGAEWNPLFVSIAGIPGRAGICGCDDQLLCSKLRAVSWFWGRGGAQARWYIAVLAAANGRWLLGLGIDKRLVAFENNYVHPGQLVGQ